MRTILVGGLILLVANAAFAAGADDWNREEVRFTSGRFALAGSLLTPRDDGPHPVIVYVWGSGPTNVERHIERSQVLKTFVADGFAVLLYDKPGSESLPAGLHAGPARRLPRHRRRRPFTGVPRHGGGMAGTVEDSPAAILTGPAACLALRLTYAYPLSILHA